MRLINREMERIAVEKGINMLASSHGSSHHVLSCASTEGEPRGASKQPMPACHGIGEQIMVVVFCFKFKKN